VISSALGRDTRAVDLRVDSKSALALEKNPVFHEQTNIVGPASITAECSPTVDDETIKREVTHVRIFVKLCTYTTTRPIDSASLVLG
jgi:hypothetical protein